MHEQPVSQRLICNLQIVNSMFQYEQLKENNYTNVNKANNLVYTDSTFTSYGLM